MKAFSWVVLVQGLYYLVTGVWPLVSMRSFERISGPKRDHWLVKTVGVLIAVVAAVLLLAAARADRTPELRLLAAGTAAALAGVDTVYAGKGVIWRIYLADAAVEIRILTAKQ